METTQTIDKNIINLSIYEIEKDSIYLHTYTALWCNPCKRIKPKLIEIMSKHNYKLIEEKTIDKPFFKQNINDYVPFFELVKNNEKIDSIQTSDELLFIQFLSKNKIATLVIDNDF